MFSTDRLTGLPRFRLPSRNWMIFLSITGSFAAAITYDRWQTRKVKDKWCKLVSHMADEPLDTKSLPRTLTIYLSAPPGDGLRSAREHFHNYVKPILVAAAINWDVVEGRKEGDIRYKTAERIRRHRRLDGEGAPLEPEDYSVEQVRKNSGVTAFKGAAGDLIVGRHTWKEYIRGMHEGWLGPVDPPAHVDAAMGTLPEPEPESAASVAAASSSSVAAPDATPDATSVTALHDVLATPQTTESKDDRSETAEKPEEKSKEEEEEKPKPRQPPPYITPDSYPTALASRLLPDTFEPTAPVSCPHILGFRNTHIRLYRYLTRRRLADDIGRQVAGAVFGFSRAFDSVSLATSVDDNSPSGSSSSSGGVVSQPEQSQTLVREERDWWKTVRQPRKEFEESVLIEPMAFDDRIISRMRKFELRSEDEQQGGSR